MEVRVVIKCHIPRAAQTLYNVTLMEANRGKPTLFHLQVNDHSGRDAWFNADREIASKTNAEFLKAYYLKGMMEPEIDKELEPYLFITHKCNMVSDLYILTFSLSHLIF